MRQLSSILSTLSTEQLITLRADIDKKIENRLYFKKLNQERHPDIIDNCFTTIIEEHGFNRTNTKYSASGNLLTIDYELLDSDDKDLNFEFTSLHVNDLVRANKRLFAEYGIGCFISLSSISNVNKFLRLNSSHKRITGTNFFDLKTIHTEELNSFIGHLVVLSVRIKIDFNKSTNV